MTIHSSKEFNLRVINGEMFPICSMAYKDGNLVFLSLPYTCTLFSYVIPNWHGYSRFKSSQSSPTAFLILLMFSSE